MTTTTPFSTAGGYRDADLIEWRGVRLARSFGAPAQEYRAARDRAGLFDRSDRGVLIAAGRDRKPWLHNLVTNAVKTLDDHAGAYAFATDLKGRTQFDLNILVRPEALWLDLDRVALPAARAHFERYLLSEDVTLRDASGEYARLACIGPEAARLAATIPIPNFPALPALQSVELVGEQAIILRHDLTAAPGFEMIVPIREAAAWWDRLATAGATPAGVAALDALRIEAGFPWLGRDIDDKTLPPETGQVERGISYHKGCYLGQEVIERMRSRGSLAKRLVRLRLAEGAALALPAPMLRDGAEAGRITSLVAHPLGTGWIGLGYLRTGLDGAGLTAGDPPREVTIV